MRAHDCDICKGALHPSLPTGRYAYLFGQYLGDGCIARMKNGVYRLQIYSDMKYPNVIRQCADAMCAVMPSNRVNVAQRRGRRLVIISSYSKHWPCLFPQHGPGLKYSRKISLTHWQFAIIEHYPEAFLRGLIHSDGCRVINRVQKRKYQYLRYNFMNKSEDILRLFTEGCDQLGIAWRRMNAQSISVARRDSVALMDTFIGPKT